jgi:hypothetical protein
MVYCSDAPSFTSRLVVHLRMNLGKPTAVDAGLIDRHDKMKMSRNQPADGPQTARYRTPVIGNAYALCESFIDDPITAKNSQAQRWRPARAYP